MRFTDGQMKILDMFKTGRNLLVLGGSGTGKSTVIDTICEIALHFGKRVAVTASTGIAAQLIGGRTIHSFLKAFPGMDLNAIDYNEKIVNLEEIDVLIVDEISMIGCSFVEYFYKCMRKVSHPVQIVLVGDFFQLPPVQDSYAFTSAYWPGLGLTPCFLHEVVRQGDLEFVETINRLKFGDKSCLEYLLTHSSPHTFPGQISICATNDEAKEINDVAMASLVGPEMIYAANYDGRVDKADLRVELNLFVKKGMRVMSVLNGFGYSNGSLGTVTGFDDVNVEVLFDNGNSVVFQKEPFTVDRKDKPGLTTDLWQIPLRPAYAITIHKSQGQTFNYVNINGTRCWAPGQLYVAVSRARSISGIHFLTPIREDNIKTSPDVINFYKSIERTW